jgi:hypothetical protein
MNVEDWRRRRNGIDFYDHLELNFDDFGYEHWVLNVRF